MKHHEIKAEMTFHEACLDIYQPDKPAAIIAAETSPRTISPNVTWPPRLAPPLGGNHIRRADNMPSYLKQKREK